MPRTDRRPGKQWVIRLERLDADVMIDGQVALCARVGERGGPELVVEVSFSYFPTRSRALTAKLLKRWPWLPLSKPTTKTFAHSMVYPSPKFRPRR